MRLALIIDLAGFGADSLYKLIEIINTINNLSNTDLLNLTCVHEKLINLKNWSKL